MSLRAQVAPLILAFAALAAAGCGDGATPATPGRGPAGTLLHEHQLAADPSLRASFSKAVTGRLETGTDGAHPHDTGTPGVDHLPFRVTKETTLCVLLDSETIGSAEIRSGAAGGARVESGGDMRITLRPGDHTLVLASNGSSESIYLVRPTTCGPDGSGALARTATAGGPAPAVYIENVGSLHTIAQASTSVAAFVGVTPESQTGAATLVTSLTDFTTTFGDVSADSLTSLAVDQFFQNGGEAAYVVGVSASGPSAPTVDDLLPEGTLAGADSFPTSGVNTYVLPDLARMSAADVGRVVPVVAELAEQQNAFFIVDAPLSIDTVSGMQSFVSSTLDPGSLGSSASYAAIYFPPLQALLTNGASVPIGVGGVAAGIFASTAAGSGVWSQPAGPGNGVLTTVTLGPVSLDQETIATLSAADINGIRPPSDGQGLAIWGSKTLATPGAGFSYIESRRTMNFIIESIDEGLQWVQFEPNDPTLQASVTSAVGAFLMNLWQEGGLFGETASEAFRITCNESNNPPEIRVQGLLHLDIEISLDPSNALVPRSFTFETSPS